jgi:hypothetical protein
MVKGLANKHMVLCFKVIATMFNACYSKFINSLPLGKEVCKRLSAQSRNRDEIKVRLIF